MVFTVGRTVSPHFAPTVPMIPHFTPAASRTDFMIWATVVFPFVPVMLITAISFDGARKKFTEQSARAALVLLQRIICASSGSETVFSQRKTRQPFSYALFAKA